MFGVSNEIDDMDDGGSGGDSDLEAELAAITSGGRAKPRPKPKPVVPAAELDRMIADSLKDIGSDEELSDDDDDPDLLNELSEITGDEPTNEEPTQELVQTETITDVIGLLKIRLEMYKTAEANAKTAGDSGKARRFNRGLKTIQDFLKKAERGGAINMDEVPPEVSTKPVEKMADEAEVASPPLMPTRPAPAPMPSPTGSLPPIPPRQNISPPTEEAPIAPEMSPPTENPTVVMLRSRQKEYKLYALQQKKSGDNAAAMQFIKVAKQFDAVIKAVEEGQEVDLSNMPPPPTAYVVPSSEEPAPPAAIAVDPPEAPREESEVQNSTELPEEVLVMASSIGEALDQRLEKYRAVELAAKEEGNSGKARRFGRIIKQYEDAIKKHKAGKPIPLDELPCPPGFGPFPGEAGASPVPAPVIAPKPSPSQPPSDEPVAPTEGRPRPPLRKQDSRVSGNHQNTHVMNIQIAELKSRQQEFKLAALNAKKAGDIEQAKEYLKIYKGFDSLLGVAESGLPVDMATLPIPPSQRSNLEDSFTFVNDNDCDSDNPESEITTRLEEQLQKQLVMCKTTRDHLRALGDVPGTNRFENLGLSVQKDLDLVRLAHKKRLPIPKFHYEMKNFNIVKCNTDLTDNQVDLEIIRGINYNVPNPKEVDTYVKVEFPWPQEETYKNKTNVIKNTDNPEYNTNYVIDIQRSNRQCHRIFKRQAVKLEVYSKG